ncbi:AAA domain-containing protein [Pseudonocardia kunmingensis]|uniref:AAA domain-containing protein n=1 Tax=Pseudonocardia kunmingensis TaxID=630975 RepID=A0A543DAT0_9PSEU|nr:AAA domain-containing protein [Pseudonocardia kunmingensis]
MQPPLSVDQRLRHLAAALPNTAGVVMRRADGTGKSVEQQQLELEERLLSEELTRRRVKHRANEIQDDALFTPPDVPPPTLADELALPNDGPKYALDELLILGGNALITARRKTGKTVLIANLAKSYADDAPFLGCFKVTPLPEGQRIAILDYELAETQFRDWARALHIQNADRVTTLHLRGQGFKLTAPTAQKWLVEHCKRLNVGAIICDPYSRAFRGFGKSNDNDDVGRFTDTLEEVKYQIGARELYLTNHMGWGEEERSRGASALEDWPDALWRLTKNERDSDSSRYFSAPLGRGVELEEGKLTFNPVTLELIYGSGNRTDEAHKRVEDLVLDYVRDHPGASSSEIQNTVKGASKEDIGDAKSRLIGDGRLRVEKDGRTHKHFVTVMRMRGVAVRGA